METRIPMATSVKTGNRTRALIVNNTFNQWLRVFALGLFVLVAGQNDSFAAGSDNKFGVKSTSGSSGGYRVGRGWTKRSGEHYGTAMYEEVVTDMEVKVQGGLLSVTRHWKEAESPHWVFNPNWADLQISADEITRNNYVYKKAGSTGSVFAYEERKTVTKTASGYRWSDRNGNWIDYDQNGKALRYGDNNNITVSFTRDSSGRINKVLDHFDQVVLTMTYVNATQLSSVTDYTGRKVEYIYTGGELTRVKDVRGFNWYYTYGTVLDKRVMNTKTDPEGHVTTMRHVVNKGGAFCSGSSGGSWIFNEEKERWEIIGGTCSRFTILGPTAYFEGISDELGILTKINYFFDAPTKTYFNVRSSGGRRVGKRVNLRGETLKKEINGEVEKEVSISTDRRRRVVKDRRGMETVYEYDEYENPTRITYPDKTVQQWTYNRYSDVLTYTNENGVRLKNDYDANGNLIRTTEAVGLPEQRVTEYEYDELGNLVLMRELGDANTAEAVTRWTSFDNYGNPLTQIDPEGVQTQYTYDVLGNPLTIVDGRENTWVNTYDAAGNLLTEADPLNNFTRYSYDGIGNLVTVTDALEIVVQRYTYDARGNITSATDAFGNSKILTYVDSKLTRVRDEKGNNTTISYEQHGRPHKITDPAGNVIELLYEAGEAGKYSTSFYQVSGIRYPTFTERYGYDERFRLNSVVRIANGQQQVIAKYRYDAAGNVIEATGAEDKTSAISYDAHNRRVAFRDPDQNSVFYDYDNRDNLLGVTNALNIVLRQFTYDRNNQLKTETWPTGNVFTFSYDANGNLVEKIDGKGQRYKGIYDIANRVTNEEYYTSVSATTPVKTIAYSYNKVGSITGFNDGTFSGTYAFDAMQRLLNETVNYGTFSKSHSYTYTATGKKASFTNPDATLNSYLYDNADRLSSMSIPGQGSITVNAYNWIAPAKITFPSGSVQENTYDPFMRISQINVRDPAGNVLMDYGYQYDTSGNIKSKSTEHGVYTYGYDNLDRLVSALNPTLASEAYSYDATGNRKTSLDTAEALWQYNDSNQLLQAGPNRSYSYDANGSMTTRTINGVTETFVYDIENRLSEVRDAQNSLVARYQYDPFGRRLAKTVNGQTTFFHYADEGLVAEYDGAGAVIQTYGYQPDAIWSTDPTYTKIGNDIQYYANDHLGTPQKLFGADGSVGWSGAISAFGVGAASRGANPLRFPGQYFDQETGLSQNYFRDYDPVVGRYLQSDPIGLFGGMNTYGYTYGNPIMFYDPFGLWSPPPLPQGLVDAAAGFGDTLSFGGTNLVRELFGWNDAVNKCSSEYGYGEGGAIAMSLAFGGAHLGRNALYQQTKRGGLMTGIKRLAKDPRKWDTVRDQWSLAAGKGRRALKKRGQQLHHWDQPQSLGGSNAGWNYMPISDKLNNLMGNGTLNLTQRLTFNGFKGTVYGIYGAIPTAAVSNSLEDCGCD